MFVFSVKAGRKQVLAAAVGAVAVTVALVCAVVLPSSHVATSGRAVSLTVRSGEERLQLLRDLGHEIQPNTEQVEEIRLPDEPDEALRAYDALQTPAGLGLMDYAGKRVKCYTYTVTNAEAEGTVLARMYVYRNRVIAGDVSSAAPDGFEQPLIPAL